MVSTLTPSEESQLLQTIEMFEVITQSQPQDYQSLEILKEAYVKLGRDQEAIGTSKRIANAYVLMGQLSSAILEYESILQRSPDDPDVLAALGEIESKANSLTTTPAEVPEVAKSQGHQTSRIKAGGKRAVVTESDDGRDSMRKIFVDAKIISGAQFDECWPKIDASVTPTAVIEPFLQIVADKGYLQWEKALKILSDKARLGYFPLDKYDIDVELSRTFPADVCRRWCILPFDKLSKSLLVATTNPFNRQAAAELEADSKQRILWYLAPPVEIVKALRKVFR